MEDDKRAGENLVHEQCRNLAVFARGVSRILFHLLDDPLANLVAGYCFQPPESIIRLKLTSLRVKTVMGIISPIPMLERRSKLREAHRPWLCCSVRPLDSLFEPCANEASGYSCSTAT